MAIITTLAAPPLIRVAFKGEDAVVQDGKYTSELQHEIS
jgi:hypothetical protein